MNGHFLQGLGKVKVRRRARSLWASSSAGKKQLTDIDCKANIEGQEQGERQIPLSLYCEYFELHHFISEVQVQDKIPCQMKRKRNFDCRMLTNLDINN